MFLYGAAGMITFGVWVSGETYYKQSHFGEEITMEHTLALVASVLGIAVSVALFAGQVMA